MEEETGEGTGRPRSASRRRAVTSFRMRGLRLRAGEPGAFFTVHLAGEVRRPPDGEPADPGAPDHTGSARRRLRERVERILAGRSALDPLGARDAANDGICAWFAPAPGPEVCGSVRLRVRRRDRRAAEEHHRFLAAVEREGAEVALRLDLLRDVLADPDRRTAWWIERHPDRLGDLEDLHGATGSLRPRRVADRDPLHEEVARFVDHLLTDLRTPPQREVFLRALTTALHTLGSEDLRAVAGRWTPVGSPAAGEREGGVPAPP
ncbi:hypothetical protein GCM10027160_45500 [Streptomyces calidiresistens]|uniref:Uncharacterized protein n=1 Tax=Streptomyces calidiresistens TaxID=1485586 RepID=A0A7W3T0U5_9ACTN|nr:hypothetical protein [Streptomyces calidiresistens]MBB0228778.1 hypothetical protein [Streptomyces calidiresistens]